MIARVRGAPTLWDVAICVIGLREGNKLRNKDRLKLKCSGEVAITLLLITKRKSEGDFSSNNDLFSFCGLGIIGFSPRDLRER